ncbi:hypothetical protein [Paracoccus mutanolyticus]|uniref:hypothetical protein n=1 Tax=Paracoccus mutanolyticus TaxID=1499308 RepID=UPI0011AEB5BA|nr:hypothetical protein [Paracoccus mutanolyticus]
MSEIVDKLGAPHVLVNCAGIAPGKRIIGRSGPMDLEEFERVVRVNLILSAVGGRCLRAAARSTRPAISHLSGLVKRQEASK